MAELVAQLEASVGHSAGGPGPRLSEPREIAFFSKSREGTAFDRSGLARFAQPELPVDLNVGLNLFRDRDRTNPYPAPISNILRSLTAHGQEDALRQGPCFVTFRGNIAKLLLVPYNNNEEWHIEAERQGSVIFLNVKEPESSLQRQTRDARDPRKRAMQYWGFAWEEVCNSGGAGLAVGIDSTEGFNSVAVSTLGIHRLIVASEVDSHAAPPPAGAAPGSSCRMRDYCELKTTRLMDNPRQVENFERHKLLKWWAQSYPAGVPRIIVGFRDDDGFVQKVQELQTAKLPRYVASKKWAWDPVACLVFLDLALTWLRDKLDEAPEGTRFRMEFTPPPSRSAHRQHGQQGTILLVRDPGIRPFVSDASESKLYSPTLADDKLGPSDGTGAYDSARKSKLADYAASSSAELQGSSQTSLSQHHDNTGQACKKIRMY